MTRVSESIDVFKPAAVLYSLFISTNLKIGYVTGVMKCDKLNPYTEVWNLICSFNSTNERHIQR